MTFAELGVKEKKELVDLALKRAKISSKFFRPFHEKWVRFYKIYRSLADAVYDSDEPNLFLPYAYGIIEDMVPSVIGGLLGSKPPCKVRAKKAGDEKLAENFSMYARGIYGDPEFENDLDESMREYAITGNAWMRDGWVDERKQGKEWVTVTAHAPMDRVTLDGKKITINSQVDYVQYREIPAEYKVKYGFNVAFPSVFDVFPEPRVKKVKKMRWILEQERSESLTELQKQFYSDENGQKVPVYDFSELLKEKEGHVPGSITPAAPESIFSNDYGSEIERILGGVSEKEVNPEWDGDKVHLLHVFEPERVYTVAQGNYVVRYKEFALHYPILPYHLVKYTPDKSGLYGIGAIEPCEDMFYELKDIHQMAMSGWFRNINRMVAYHAEAVPFPDDFKPRALGKIRIKPPPGIARIQDAIYPIDHVDVTTSMLAQESNIKGLIERTASISDLSPGVQGTKQTHETLGGLLQIQQNMAKRFVIIRKAWLSAFQEQMFIMERMVNQFMFDEIDIDSFQQDSYSESKTIKREDILSKNGFKFLIEADVAYGDESILRNQMMVLLDIALKYEGFRRGDPNLKKMDVGEIMSKVLKSFGWFDTSAILKDEKQLVDPAQEFAMMVQGRAVPPNPQEDLVNHYLVHSGMERDPGILKQVAEGKIPRETMLALAAHREVTGRLIGEALKNPMAVGQLKAMAISQSMNGKEAEPA